MEIPDFACTHLKRSHDINLYQVLGVIENYSRLPPSFKERSLQMFHKYYPIELDPHIPLDEKIPLMLEWYHSAHEMMKESDLYRKDFALMVEESSISFR